MGCYHPLSAYVHDRLDGRRTIKVCKSYRGPDTVGFDDSRLFPGETVRHVLLPCGQCIFCRLRKSLEWTVRCWHEYRMTSKGVFLTLTYDDDHLPCLDGTRIGTLRYNDFQLFAKRLRQKVGSFRFLMCGEYGSHGTRRPHYHAILFGLTLDDLQPWKREPTYVLYRSKTVESAWQNGFCTVGEIEPSCINYVCRYNLKKVTGAKADDWYQGRTPEFLRMSLKPGIGAGWLSHFQDDVYKLDYITDEVIRDSVRYNGHDVRPPRYYDKLLARTDDWSAVVIQMAREQFAESQPLPTYDELNRLESVAKDRAAKALATKALRDRHYGVRKL